MKDVELPRFSYDGFLHHGESLRKDAERQRKDQKEMDELKKSSSGCRQNYQSGK